LINSVLFHSGVAQLNHAVTVQFNGISTYVDFELNQHALITFISTFTTAVDNSKYALTDFCFCVEFWPILVLLCDSATARRAFYFAR